MNKLGILDLKKVCRLCLSESENTHSIFTEVETEGFKFNIPQLLSKITDIWLVDAEELPNKMCGRCLEFLIEITKFLKSCMDSKKIIETYHKQLKVSNIEVKYIIKEEVIQDENCDTISEDNILEEGRVNDTADIEEDSSSNSSSIHDSIVKNENLHEFEEIQEPELKEDPQSHHWSSECKSSIPEDEKSKSEVKLKNKSNYKAFAYYVKTLEDEKKVYACNLCDEHFNVANELKKHLPSHGDKPHWCNECKKGFSRHNLLRIHLQRHDDIKRHQCHLCEKSFRERSTLVIHIRSHKGEKPYLCSQCGKAFRGSRDLKVHLITHSEEYNHPCNHCDKKYKRIETLKEHLKTHTGNKMHKCSVCSKAFYQLYSLKIHEKIHTGEKPFACDICQKAFIRKSTLQVHIKTHSGFRPHVCKVCQKGFTQAHSLRTHIRIHEKQ